MVGGNQSPGSDPQSPPLPPSPGGSSNKARASSSNLLISPRLFFFNGPPLLSPKGFSDSSSSSSSSSSSAMSPTSILEAKPFSSIVNLLHFSDHNKSTKKKPPFPPKAIGLAIAGKEDMAEPPNPQSRMALFGSQLKIQVPSMNPGSSPSTTPLMESPIEFGIKNRDSQLALFFPRPSSPPPLPRVIIGRSISASEMELSEDYTCVTTHGPCPKTTHIFDDCVMESSGDGFIIAAPAASKKKSTPAVDFLSYCDACKKNLGQGKETFMYRGEKAFCSNECRHQVMIADEITQSCLPESASGI